MRYDNKKKLMEFIATHNDGSELYDEVKRIMETELNYADCESHSVSVEDLKSLSDEQQAELREKLGKDEDEEWTIEDCVSVADELAEWIGDDYGEDIYNTIHFSSF